MLYWVQTSVEVHYLKCLGLPYYQSVGRTVSQILAIWGELYQVLGLLEGFREIHSSNTIAAEQ